MLFFGFKLNVVMKKIVILPRIGTNAENIINILKRIQHVLLQFYKQPNAGSHQSSKNTMCLLVFHQTQLFEIEILQKIKVLNPI
jgi:hypothetical protein